VHEDEAANLHIACESMYGTIIISKAGKIIQNTFQIPTGERENVRIQFEKKEPSTLFFSYADSSLVTKKNIKKATVDFVTENVAILLKEDNYIVFSDGNTLSVVHENGELIYTEESHAKPIAMKALSDTTFFVGYDFGGGVIMDIKGSVSKRFFTDKICFRFFNRSRRRLLVFHLTFRSILCKITSDKSLKNRDK
jgi:hypothetical protein